MPAKPAFGAARWTAIKEEARQVLIEMARAGRTVTYAELCRLLQTAYIHYHSPLLTRLLEELGAEELAAGRPVLPALVVAKQTGMPGAGYFKVAGELNDETAADARQRWEQDLHTAFAYWSEH